MTPIEIVLVIALIIGGSAVVYLQLKNFQYKQQCEQQKKLAEILTKQPSSAGAKPSLDKEDKA